VPDSSTASASEDTPRARITILDDDINDAQWRGVVEEFDIVDDCTPWSVGRDAVSDHK
jgi:hypothetical protein